MNKKILSAAWAAGFLLCAGLGFIPNPQGLGRAVLAVLAAASFIPAFLLLHLSGNQADRKTIQLIRNLSLMSLGLTLVLLVVNFLSVRLPDAAGDILYGILVIVSSPMVCSQYWILSLFLWACLLFASIFKLMKK